MTRPVGPDCGTGIGTDGPDVPVGRVLGLVRPERWRLALTVVLAAATAAAGVALLGTSAWLLSRAAQRPSVVALGLAVIGVRFFAVSRGVLRYAERLVGHDAALRDLADLRVDVYRRLETLAPAGLPAFRRGDLLARLVQDVDTLQDLMIRVIPPYGAVLLVGIPTTALIWYFLPSSGLVLALSLLAGAVVVPGWTCRMARRRESMQASARGELSAQVVDLLEGGPELVAFGAVDAQLARVAAADAELTRITAATSFTAGVGGGLVTLLTGVAVWATLVVGVPAVHSGRLAGPLLAVVALVPLALFDVVAALPPARQGLERVRRSADRVFEVMDAQPVVHDPPVPAALADRPHHLRVQGLRARYRPDGPWALDGIDLDLPPGKRIAIIGPSGAGKSTLAAVLLRFLSYEQGSVTLDGVELTDLTGDDVRRVVGLAAQDTHIFDTTLRENLLVARRDSSDGTLGDALARVHLLEWATELPAGLDTLVGGHGATMSGGQQQRVGIARATLAGFALLVLDEPGEHLDQATAGALIADVIDLTWGRSTILITHRLAGLDAMDEILVLDAGRVIERGTHDELIGAGGRYSTQWQRECRIDAGRGVPP
jgi:thiol reductant ABC exporter CydC subunit